jgi:DNA-binding NarL/FixJ family response regulator
MDLESAVEAVRVAELERQTAIRDAHANGLSLRAIAAVTGDSPETVRKIVKSRR